MEAFLGQNIHEIVTNTLIRTSVYGDLKPLVGGCLSDQDAIKEQMNYAAVIINRENLYAGRDEPTGKPLSQIETAKAVAMGVLAAEAAKGR